MQEHLLSRVNENFRLFKMDVHLVHWSLKPVQNEYTQRCSRNHSISKQIYGEKGIVYDIDHAVFSVNNSVTV